MRLNQLLAELRSNSDRNNNRVRGHTGAVPLVKSYMQSSDNIGVSMTQLPKLGVNPSTKYETPVAICFYPADYYVQTKEAGVELPFVDNAPYIQIIEATGYVLHLRHMQDADYQDLYDTLVDNIHGIADIVGADEKTVKTTLGRSHRIAKIRAAVKSPGGFFWYLLYELSHIWSPKTKTTARGTPRSAIVWNKLLRLIGVQAVIDDGEGILHPNEPYQGMVFDPTAVKLLNTINNAVENRSEIDWALHELVKSFEPSGYYINYAVKRYANDETGEPASEAVLRKFFGKIISAIKEHPEIISVLDNTALVIIRRNTSDSAVIHAIDVATILQQWKLHKSKLLNLCETMRDELDEYTNPKYKEIAIRTLKNIYHADYGRAVWFLNRIKELNYQPTDENSQSMVDAVTFLANTLAP